ncbi:MAG TPA: hypothetical protein VE684_14050, partial [Crenalkalicoccus sp.]|nr:hypothetical protein [Crenalkalicoccus sp.]
MSDITIPSYRVRPERENAPWRMLAVTGGLIGALGCGGAVVWGLHRSATPAAVPVIEPDPRPIKVRPEKPGGLVVPNQDNLVLEPPAVRRAVELNADEKARLAPGPEAPALDLLRERVAPPTAEPPPAIP